MRGSMFIFCFAIFALETLGDLWMPYKFAACLFGADEEEPQSAAAAAADLLAKEAKADAAALATQLQALLQYLRHKHAYCFWCGARYDSLEQLQETCPGSDEQDH